MSGCCPTVLRVLSGEWTEAGNLGVGKWEGSGNQKPGFSVQAGKGDAEGYGVPGLCRWSGGSKTRFLWREGEPTKWGEPHYATVSTVSLSHCLTVSGVLSVIAG